MTFKKKLLKALNHDPRLKFRVKTKFVAEGLDLPKKLTKKRINELVFDDSVEAVHLLWSDGNTSIVAPGKSQIDYIKQGEPIELKTGPLRELVGKRVHYIDNWQANSLFTPTPRVDVIEKVHNRQVFFESGNTFAFSEIYQLNRLTDYEARSF